MQKYTVYSLVVKICHHQVKDIQIDVELFYTSDKTIITHSIRNATASFELFMSCNISYRLGYYILLLCTIGGESI